MNAILIDEFYPDATRDSGSIDTLNYIEALTQLGYGVTLLTTVSTAQGRPDSIGTTAEFDWVPAEQMESWLLRHSRKVGLIFICRPGPMSAWCHRIRVMSPTATLIYVTVDLHFLRLEREFSAFGNHDRLAESRRYRAVELENIRQADLSVVVSSFERDYLRSVDSRLRVQYVPLFRNRVGSNRGFADRPKRAVFIGGYQHLPNIDAAHYLAENVLPYIRHADPEIELVLAGSNMPERVRKLEQLGIKAIGQVPDLVEFFDSARISVAPLRFGAGQKGKVLSSLAHLLPVVCTSVAAEGMFDGAPQGVVIADDALELAANIVTLCNDNEAWTRLSSQADQFAQERDLSQMPVVMGRLIERAQHFKTDTSVASSRNSREPVLSILLMTRDGFSANPSVIRSWISQVEASQSTELLILNAGKPVQVPFRIERITEVLGFEGGNDRYREGLQRAKGSHIRFASDDDPILSDTVHALESQVLLNNYDSYVTTIGDFMLKSVYGLSVCEQVYHLYPQGTESYRTFINSQGAIPAYYSVFPKSVVAQWHSYITEHSVPFSYTDWLLTTLAFGSTRVRHPGRGVMGSYYDQSNWCDQSTSELRNLEIMKNSGVPNSILPLINLFWLIDALSLLQRSGLEREESNIDISQVIVQDQLKRFVDNLEFRLKVIDRHSDGIYIDHISILSPVMNWEKFDLGELRSVLKEVVVRLEGAVPVSLQHYF
jgi:glycosyltransferase involved in cell wall biosynthesis